MDWVGLETAPFPSFERRGGCAIKKTIPFLSGAAGVVSKRSRSLLILFEITNHPVCAAKDALQHLLIAQPPLLSKEGNGAVSHPHFPSEPSLFLRF